MKLFEERMVVPRRMLWVEDAAPDSNVVRGAQGSAFIGTAVSTRRIIFFAVIALIGLLSMFGRTFFLQMMQGDEWRVIAERNRMRAQPIIPERGIIFDRAMVPLVANVPNFRLTIRAQDLPRAPREREAHIREIGKTIAVPSDKIEQVLTAFQKYHYASVVVKDPISYDEAVSVYLKSAAFPSVTIERSAKRQYIAGIPGSHTDLTDGFSHLLGYLGRISPDELDAHGASALYFPTALIGKTGIELLFETYLRGTPGVRDAEVDARGAARRTVSVSEPEPGSSLVLTIDE